MPMNKAKLFSILLAALFTFNLTACASDVRDNESQEMIELILSNVKFDFGNIYTHTIAGGGSGPGHLLRLCILNKNKDFASMYASNEANFQSNLDKLIEKFSEE